MDSAALPFPVLWLIGAVGTGKSNTSYHVFARLWRSGTPIARLDLDDLGMCHPAPANDPQNYAAKTEIMAAAWEVQRRHGATCLVLSGGVETEAEVAVHTSALPHAAWTICRLRIGPEERRRRTADRGALLGSTDTEITFWIKAGDVEEAQLDSRALADHIVDIDGLDRAQVVDAVLATTGWPGPR